MLYKKNHSPALDNELFKNPTAEYRGTPFWSWNCELDKDELLRQIECLKQMGFGGFHMHSRAGMATEYLGKEFMQLVDACTQKAKEENMLSWLYDEDRFSSGSAGGYVTKIKKYRQRILVFSTIPIENAEPKESAVLNGNPYFIAAYDVSLSKDGTLSSYRLISENEHAEGIKWFAYCTTTATSGWWNGQTYVDTLNPEAIKKFIEVTHDAYKKAVGDEFGKTIPAIFTDEPNFARKETFSFAENTNNVTLPWTPDFDISFKSAYGFDILEKLPELFWDLPDGEVSCARYCYHDHVCERFVSACCDQLGNWCQKNGLYLTGHVLEEPTLCSQTAVIGEAMRSYRSFGIPGIDMLCNRTEYSTAKQAQSAAHQYGNEGVMSELYGVTDWDFDFRGHKFQGDWQAALGVTVRVPHLSWVSMKGSAKRDYPASINYQSPWYTEYSYIENHYARLATALTRGKPCVNIGVIHPIESYWLHWGPSANTAAHRKQLDDNFKNLIEWMLFNSMDFDFISESTLPDLCKSTDRLLTVGEMSYSAIIVPFCETLRKSTVDILNKFIASGGKVIFAGECPKYVDAVKSNDVRTLYARAITVPFEKEAILASVKDERVIEIKDDKGETPESFIYQLRKDSDDYWLFLANAKPHIDVRCTATPKPVNVFIKIKGEFTPVLYDTMSGDIRETSFSACDGYTVIPYSFYEHDSLLLKLTPKSASSFAPPKENKKVIAACDFKQPAERILEEDNVLVLDMAEFSLNGEPWHETEEILHIDKNLRKELSWPLADGLDVQPWLIEKEKITDYVTLRFKVNCEQDFPNTFFCTEELTELSINGKNVDLEPDGYFVDKAFKKYPLPTLLKGENIILAKQPIGKRTSLEASYLTGDFDVRVAGCCQTLIKPSHTVAFGSLDRQGMPFYGGNITYRMKINVPEDCDMRVNIAKYAGALTKVILDGEDKGNIVFAPYELTIPGVSRGEHIIDFKLFGNRYNTFGSLHNCADNLTWRGASSSWYTSGDSWCYEYNTKPMGILKSPVITYLK